MVKRKFYKTFVRLAITCESEYWALNQIEKTKIKITK